MDKSQHLNEFLSSETRSRVESRDKNICEEWGGEMYNGVCGVSSLDNGTDYTKQTIVRSGEDALAAFDYYTDYFNHILETYEEKSTTAVLLPCGAEKPIGSSSIHSKKVDALAEAGYVPESDIIIISEPCGIIPHENRLSLPAVNYDFPPEFTKEEEYPAVFDVFTDRLARWIDESSYTKFYSYLVSGHQRKIDAALEKADSNPEIVLVPGASLNPETMNYSGDLFKKRSDIVTKLEFVKEFRDSDSSVSVDTYSEDVREFYETRFL